MKGGIVRALQLEVEQLKAMVNSFETSCNHFKGHLHSDKFSGVDSSGERKDLIATGDVLNWIRDMSIAASLAYEGWAGCPTCGRAMEVGQTECVSCRVRTRDYERSGFGGGK